MRDFLKNLLQQYGDNKLFIAIAAAVVGAVLTKLIPTLWRWLHSFVLWIGKIAGGRFAYHDFQKRYLDWVVTEHRELKLTGIVTSDDAKKPKLEQVFVSLRVGRQRDSDTVANEVAEGFSLQGSLPTWRDLREMLSMPLNVAANSTIRFKVEDALSTVKTLERKYKKKKLFTKLFGSSALIEEHSRNEREAWVRRNIHFINLWC